MFWLSMRVLDFHVINVNEVSPLKALLLLTRKRNTFSSSKILNSLSLLHRLGYCAIVLLLRAGLVCVVVVQARVQSGAWVRILIEIWERKK